MRLTLRQLQLFAAVAQTGSTTAAAASVALSQSATSAALNELENLLNARLFDRVGKRLALNDNGRGLLAQARWILDGAKNIEDQFLSAGKSLESLLRVGASTTIGNYVMPALVAGFRKNSTRGHIAVQIGNTQEIAAGVANFDVDIGFIEGRCHEPLLKVVPWLTDELVIVCSPNHSLAHGRRQKKVPPKVLAQAQWLLREPGSGTREAVEDALLPHLHHMNMEMELGSSEAIKYAVAEGLGLTCLSRCVVEDLIKLGRLVILSTTLPKLSRRFYLVHHSKKYISAGLDRFMTHCLSGRGELPNYSASRS